MRDLWNLFIAFFKIGIFTIGGGLAMLPLIQRVVVEDYKWLNEDEMIDCIAICQSLPGVIAINVATYIGYKKHKLKGSIAATLGTIMPSFIIIILAVICLDAVGSNPYVNGAFISLKAASCGLILFAAIKLGKQVLKSNFAWAICIVAFVMITFFGISAVWTVILGALAGLIPYWFRLKKIKNEIIENNKETASNKMNCEKDIANTPNRTNINMEIEDIEIENTKTDDIENKTTDNETTDIETSTNLLTDKEDNE